MRAPPEVVGKFVVEGSHDKGESRVAALPFESSDDAAAGTSGSLPENESPRAEKPGLGGRGGKEEGQVASVLPRPEEVGDQGPLPGNRERHPAFHLPRGRAPYHPVVARRPGV